MNLLSLHALTSPPPPTVAAPSPPADAQGFGAMLGSLSEKAPCPPERAAPANATDTGGKRESGATPDAATLSALQSLEAALSSLAPPPVKPSQAPTTDPGAATPLGKALDQAAGALGEAAATGRVTIKGMLQADPSLGLTDVRMRTFLGVSGATPARAGATPLSADAAWSLATTAPARKPDAGSQTAAPALAPALAPPRLHADPVPTPRPVGPAATPAPAAPSRKAGAEGRVAAPAAIPAFDGTAASFPKSGAVNSVGSTTARSGGGGGASPDAWGKTAATAATAPEGAAAAPLTVAFADLPAFLADQASSLAAAAETNAPASSSGSTAPAAARTAQAVKELNISLDPADLGEMTVKLRLANGKLSVSILVASPATLGAIQDDRDLIAARLASADQSLEELVISRQNAVTQEVQQTDGSHDDSGARAQKRGSDPDAPQRPPSRKGAGGGGFGALLV